MQSNDVGIMNYDCRTYATIPDPTPYENWHVRTFIITKTVVNLWLQILF